MPDTCATCGFLAVRHYQTRQLMDAEQAYRDTDYIPHVPVDHRVSVPAYDPYPICYLRQLDFTQKIARERQSVRDLTCELHEPWKQGVTPRELLEMNQAAEMLRWQREREEADREERQRRDQEARDFQAEQASLNRQYSSRNILVLIAIVVATIVGPIVGAFITAKFSDTNTTQPPAAQGEPTP